MNKLVLFLVGALSAASVQARTISVNFHANVPAHAVLNETSQELSLSGEEIEFFRLEVLAE